MDGGISAYIIQKNKFLIAKWTGMIQNFVEFLKYIKVYPNAQNQHNGSKIKKIRPWIIFCIYENNYELYNYILNYFDQRSTNASAKSFNLKINTSDYNFEVLMTKHFFCTNYLNFLLSPQLLKLIRLFQDAYVTDKVYFSYHLSKIQHLVILIVCKYSILYNLEI